MRKTLEEEEEEEKEEEEEEARDTHFISRPFFQLQEKYFKPYFISALLIQIHNKIPAASLT